MGSEEPVIYFGDCRNPEGRFLWQTLQGRSRPNQPLEISISRGIKDNWPIATVLLAVSRQDAPIPSTSDALRILVHPRLDDCAKATALIAVALDRLPVVGALAFESVEIAESVLMGFYRGSQGNVSEAGSKPEGSVADKKSADGKPAEEQVTHSDLILNLGTLIQCPSFLAGLRNLEAAVFYSRVDANEFYDEEENEYANHMQETSQPSSPSIPVAQSAYQDRSGGGYPIRKLDRYVSEDDSEPLLSPSLESESHGIFTASDSEDSFTPRCMFPEATTESGNCNVFYGASRNMKYWQSRGIFLKDVELAFKPITDQKNIWIKKTENFLHVFIPEYGNYKGVLSAEVKCVAEFFLDVLSQIPEFPDFDLVLNNGDLPLIRKKFQAPPFYDFADEDVVSPVPLFSLVASDDFQDLLFPNVCRPLATNLRQEDKENPTDRDRNFHIWKNKLSKVVYRGTDRGAINWSPKGTPVHEMKSLRKLFETELHANEDEFRDFADFALLPDDLMDASVVSSDPKFIPLPELQKYKYILDIPGNGYSGSLKQKLTSSSAVFAVTRPLLFPDHKPVCEHFYFGLKEFRDFVPVENPQDLELKISWAQSHDEMVEEISRNGNIFMDKFEKMSKCYLLKLLEEYVKSIKYQVNKTTSEILKQTAEFKFPLKARETGFSDECHQMIVEERV